MQLTILDATETSLTFTCPPPSSPTLLEYKPYGSPWPGSSVSCPGGEVTVSDLLPASTYCVRLVVGGEVVGEEMVVDTGVPGCSGSKKRTRRCVIM
mmetsp:Transcript_5023/g.9616  ORF Transcript_5023/g.9616 Transcript_5023/m.9616 type:complete len:96 (+) Transcript_5023:248-535(+)